MDHGSVPAAGAYTLAVQEDRFDPGTPAEFGFKALGPDGQAVTRYRPLHERDLHLIVVRRESPPSPTCTQREMLTGLGTSS
jgi:hypothetical protein